MTYKEWVELRKVKTVLELWDLQKYFVVQEFFSKKMYDRRGKLCLELLTPELILTAIETRVLWGRPITPNNWHLGGRFQKRGFRTQAFYKKVSLSQHLRGNAWDYDVRGVPADEVMEQELEWKAEGKLPYMSEMEKGPGVIWNHRGCRLPLRANSNGIFFFGKV